MNTGDTLSLKVLTPRANPAVGLSDAKSYLRVDGTADDALISGLVNAATDMVERVTRRSLIYQTFRMMLPTFPAGPIELPRSPAVAVNVGGAYDYALPRVRYYDTWGDLQALTDGHYHLDLDNNPPSLQLLPMDYWPLTQPGRAKALEVDWVAGYGSFATQVPPLLQQGVLMLVAHWYSNREAVGQFGGEVPLAVDSILRIYSDGGF